MTDQLNRRQLLERGAAGGAALIAPGVLAACGRLTVYVQNANPGSAAALHGRVSLSWSPEATFVVDSMEGSE